jgi:hypothetical protein
LRLICLLMILLSGLCAASTVNQPAQDESRFTLLAKPQALNDTPTSIRTYQYRLPNRVVRHRFGPPDRQSENVCYTMRSYYVRQDRTNPDSVYPDGSSTCREASRFQVRNADGDVQYNLP